MMYIKIITMNLLTIVHLRVEGGGVVRPVHEQTTMTNLSVSENSRKELLKIASTINSHLIVGPQQITYLSLMRSTCRSLQFSTSISPSAAVSTISDLTQSSASHFSEKEEANMGGRYNRLTRGYCSRNLPNGKRCLHRSLWFFNVCHDLNNKRVYYCWHVHCNCFGMHHDSLVRIP